MSGAQSAWPPPSLQYNSCALSSRHSFSCASRASLLQLLRRPGRRQVLVLREDAPGLDDQADVGRLEIFDQGEMLNGRARERQA